MIRFAYGIVFTLAFLAAAVYAGTVLGVVPAGADAKPPSIERWMAAKSLHASMAREDAAYADPLQETDANLLAGVHLYAANCAVCHGAADGKASTLARGFYIKAPQLATDGVEDDPGKMTYWKLVHGIRFSAMPAFGTSLPSEQLWQLTMFLAKMDHLPPSVDAAWKRVPSVAASATP